MKVSKKKYVLLFGVVILIMALHALGALKPLEYVVSSAVNPTQELTSPESHPTDRWGGFFSDTSGLETEIAALQEEVQRLRTQMVDTDALRQENEELKIALDYKSNSDHETIVAKVIGRETISGVTTLIINQGTRDMVHEGDFVATASGELLGEVIESNLNHALVRLITHPDNQIAVSLSTNSAPIGILSGNLSVSLTLDLIPAEIEIAEGDLIVTNSIGNHPHGVIVGNITSIEKQTGSLFNTATIEPFFNLDTTNIVHVVRIATN